MSSRRISFGIALLALSFGCSSAPSGPTAPTAVAVSRDVSQSVRSTESDGVVMGPSSSSMDRALVASFDLPRSGPSVVTFPPRNEPLAFRTALETKYRDGLRRPSVQTYVDQEGTVVWTQEYLRYRVNLCSHADAVTRVMSQIDGQGIPPTCGTANTATFPPRNEPLAFMIQLEAKYRDGLRRPSGPTFVDVEGNIVWTQEYLRYRVSSCSHADAEQKVFDQIDGRGVQRDCTPVVVAPTPTPTPSTYDWRLGVGRLDFCTATLCLDFSGSATNVGTGCATNVWFHVEFYTQEFGSILPDLLVFPADSRPSTFVVRPGQSFSFQTGVVFNTLGRHITGWRITTNYTPIGCP